MNKDMKLLRRAYDAWLAAEPLRRRRERHKRYTYGDQWSDPDTDCNGRTVEERRRIIDSGKRPLTNNLIRQLVKTIVGRYRTAAAESGAYDTSEGSFDRRNHLAELDSRMLEEFVISGCAIQRICAERREGGEGVWVDNVSPAAFFVNDYRDPRGHDIDFIGMLHDMTEAELVNRFGRGSARRVEALRRLYAGRGAGWTLDGPGSVGAPARADTDFCRARDRRLRVIETWQLAAESAADSAGRQYMAVRWQCTWLAPDGTVLSSYASPYGHGSHPFAVKHYPLTDGEVHSFVEDVIDQQRTINRLVVLIDTMLASSAKGALLFPVEQLPRGVTIDDVSRLWASPDAVIPVTGRAGAEMPRQVVTNTADSGAYQLLNLQMKLFGDVSGISDALLGRNVPAATGSSLYDAQVRNAAIALADLLETFASFTAERSDKAAKTYRN